VDNQVRFTFTNLEKNLQLLLPITITLECSGGPCLPPPLPPPPMAVYYATAPVLPNETLMIAGAGLRGATAKLCIDKDCSSPALPGALLPMAAAESTVDAWNKSIKMVLPPAGCGPPCFVQIKATQGTPSTTTVAINQPDIWWATTGSPGRPIPLAPQPPASAIGNVKATVVAGDAVRVFGRSLGWTTTAAAGAESCWGCAASELICTVRVFRQKVALEDVIGSHVCSLEASMRVTNAIPFGSSLSYQLTL
jgi:hypothetical protein